MVPLPVRRAQLIAPFGVGAMMVSSDGLSLICGGLDHWFSSTSSTNPDPEEFIVHEWRLERELGVDEFRLPPDFRTKDRTQAGERSNVNVLLKVPFLRFPQTHVCPRCGHLEEYPLIQRGSVRCEHCPQQFPTVKYRPKMVQVRFVAICGHGHIQDFPWREWVHKSSSPSCTEPMRLSSSGGADLGSLSVRCVCGARRSLAGITSGGKPADTGEGSRKETSFLSQKLDARGAAFTCQGARPWLGETRAKGVGCGEHLMGALRGATNIHYPQVLSAIYLPNGTDEPSRLLREMLGRQSVRKTIAAVGLGGGTVSGGLLKTIHGPMFEDYTAAQIEAEIAHSKEDVDPVQVRYSGDTDETAFRRQEYETLRNSRDTESLIVKEQHVEFARYPRLAGVGRLCLVEKLLETRVMTGFSRVNPSDGVYNQETSNHLLWKRTPTEKTWLPAYVTRGEGIYFELDSEKVRRWEAIPEVMARIQRLKDNQRKADEKRAIATSDPVSPRFVLLHTLAHLLINQLVFDCGYSSTALRERLFVSNDKDYPMAGVLIYTASGDSEGTMGGLVRMGQPGNLSNVMVGALEKARWCSSDPICMEVGANGQGPDSCNLAACHNCSLVPETSCEEFNRLLDRWTVVGSDVDGSNHGYFSV